MPDPCGVQICTFGPVGSKAIYSKMSLWMQIVFISSVLEKNWNLKSVTWCQRCHKQESAGCLDACNEQSGIFAHPIKRSRISNWSGKLASSSMLFNVGIDLCEALLFIAALLYMKSFENGSPLVRLSLTEKRYKNIQRRRHNLIKMFCCFRVGLFLLIWLFGGYCRPQPRFVYW